MSIGKRGKRRVWDAYQRKPWFGVLPNQSQAMNFTGIVLFVLITPMGLCYHGISVRQGSRSKGAGVSNDEIVCPACGGLVSPHARRCPHCQQVLTHIKPIERPEKLISEDGGEAWNEAADQVADLGEITWHDGIHPVNMDTRPIAETDLPPIFSPFAESATELPQAETLVTVVPPPPVQSTTRWFALGGTLCCLVLFALTLFIMQHQQAASQISAIAAEATHQAAEVGSSTSPNGKDGITPPPISPTVPLVTPPTKKLHSTPSPNPNGSPTPSTSATPVATATPVPMLVYAINAGSKSSWGTFQGDIFASSGSSYTSGNTIDTSRVTNPAPEQVYQSERWGVFTYIIPQLQAGSNYTVRLHFAEIYFGSPGSRVFNVAINGTQVLSNFDIVVAAGGPNIAVIEQFQATADAKGNIIIAFTQGPANWPKLSGLEIYTAS